MPFEVRPATRFEDVAAILNPSGNERACWCLAYRITSAEYSALRGEARADRVRGLCAGEPAPGVLAYDEDTPVGWCGIRPTDARADRRARWLMRLDLG